jgi:hypothetical protein
MKEAVRGRGGLNAVALFRWCHTKRPFLALPCAEKVAEFAKGTERSVPLPRNAKCSYQAVPFRKKGPSEKKATGVSQWPFQLMSLA